MFPRSLPSVVLAVLLLLTASPLSAQTIRGQLLDLETDQPIDLGLVIMLTEAGDSVTSTLTNPEGRFAIRSPEPGSFMLLGSAFGYRETPAGVFELGEGGEMTVEFRLRPEPIAMDGLLVGVDARVFDHQLVRNGFVRRLQRGLGHFITPYEIEQSPARDTETLFETIPGVRVRHGPGGGHVLMRGSTDALCAPTLYVDGVRLRYAPVARDPESGRANLRDVARTISSLVPLHMVEAVEVYRRAAEIPVEYGVTQSRPGGGFQGTCGVLVFWTKTGPRYGAPPDRTAEAIIAAADEGAGPALPAAEAQGAPPSAGERIRMALDSEIAASLGLGRTWEATFEGVRENELIGTDVESGRPIAVPTQGVEMLQVERDRPFRYAVRRGVIAGSAFGVGSWMMLRILCSEACGKDDQAALPAVLIGVFGGLLVGSQGPGTHWVGAPLPEGAASSPGHLDRLPPGG